MDERTIRLVNKVKNHLTAAYGEKIKGVILYGSHARGEVTKESDINVLVLVDDSIGSLIKVWPPARCDPVYAALRHEH